MAGNGGETFDAHSSLDERGVKLGDYLTHLGRVVVFEPGSTSVI